MFLLFFCLKDQGDRYCFKNQTFNPKSLVFKTVSVPATSILQPIPEDVEAELDKILDAEDID